MALGMTLPANRKAAWTHSEPGRPNPNLPCYLISGKLNRHCVNSSFGNPNLRAHRKRQPASSRRSMLPRASVFDLWYTFGKPGVVMVQPLTQSHTPPSDLGGVEPNPQYTKVE